MYGMMTTFICISWMPLRLVLSMFSPIGKACCCHKCACNNCRVNLNSIYTYDTAGDGRSKMPLSPKIADSQQSPFGLGHGLDDNNGGIELMESSSYPSASNVSHSYSSNSLGQMQFDSSNMGAFWSSYRSQMHLQSRRSQSREDLNSSLAEVHLVKS